MKKEKEKNASSRNALRDRIVDTATEAFTTEGIRSVKMDDIASRLGISKRTLYEVFVDKETLLKECLLKLQAEKHNHIEEVYARSGNVMEVILAVFQMSVEMFHKINRRFFEDLQKYPRIYELLRERRDCEAERTVAFFREGVAQGLFRQDIHFPIVKELVDAQFNVLMNTDICKRYSFVEVYESIMFTHIRGISTAQGARELEAFIEKYRHQRLE